MNTAIELPREAAEKIKQKEKDRVDGLVELNEKMRRVESLLESNASDAETLLIKTLDEFYQIEHMNKYLLLDWFDSYKDMGNYAACKMVGKQGILRYPDENRFYSRLGDIYLKKGDLEKALETYSALLRLNPNDISV